MEAVFEESLEHRPHHAIDRGAVGFGGEVEVSGVDPRGSANDIDLFGIAGTAVGEHYVRELDQILEGNARNRQGTGVRDGVLLLPPAAGRVRLDGRDVELRFGCRSLGETRGTRGDPDCEPASIHEFSSRGWGNYINFNAPEPGAPSRPWHVRRHIDEKRSMVRSGLQRVPEVRLL